MRHRYIVRGATAVAGLLTARTTIGAGTIPTPPNGGTAAALLLILWSSACTYSDLQSARLAGPGRLEVTPGYSSTSFSVNGRTERVANQFGVRAATGLTPRVDLRLRYEFLDFVNDDEEGISVVGFGPKFGLVKDRVAFHAPLGFAFGRDLNTRESWQFQPTVLLTWPVNDLAEITTSGRGVIWLNEDDAGNLFGANLGLGLSTDLNRWVIRPEVGFLMDPGEEGTLWQWSLGFTLFSDFGNQAPNTRPESGFVRH